MRYTGNTTKFTDCYKFFILNLRIIIFLKILLLCCCSAFSGNRPVPITETDRRKINESANLPFHIPLITHEFSDKSVRIYKVAFDGTMNDKERVLFNERRSIVAHIFDQLGGCYYRGPGMQNRYLRNPIDAATGYSSSDIAQGAKQDFFEQVEQWLKEERNTEIRLFVTGFSRGAAIARHFMNLVEQDWQVKSTGEQYLDSDLYFYALLFDTVATGQETELQLTIPASLDYLIHIVAQDEPRTLFRHIIDEEYIDPTSPAVEYRKTDFFGISRINKIELPGSHSDIGATYQTGIGSTYRDQAEQILYQMGLLQKNVWRSNDDHLIQGKHDSRGWLAKMLGRPAPNSEQSVNRQPVFLQAKLSKERYADNKQRLNLMIMANAERSPGLLIEKKETSGLSLQIKRENEAIFVYACKSGPAEFTNTCHFQFSVKEGKRYLDGWYTVLDQKFSARLFLSDSIWEQLREGEVATLSYSFLKTEGEKYIATYLNDILIDCSLAEKS
jgi:hypothetical protein